MKIKIDYMVRPDRWVLLLWIIILTGACRNDDSYGVQENNPVLVKLSVSTSDAGTPPTGNGTGEIQSVYILQFNTGAGGSYGTLRYVAEGTKIGNGTYTATLLQSIDNNDNYKLVILANVPGSGLYGMCGESYQNVQEACLSALTTDPLIFDATHPFPMFGVVNGGTSVQVNQNFVYSGETTLVRAVARVDIGIGTPAISQDGTITSWTKNSDTPFEMTEIQVRKAGQSYTYMPATKNFHWNSVTGNGTTSYEIVIDDPTEALKGITTKKYGAADITNGTYSIGQIYLPEAKLAWGDVYDQRHDNRLAIIVGGHYRNSPDMSYYRVDFTDDNVSAPNNKMDILRNHLYRFTISKVADKGYATADLAYNSKPKDFDFTADVTEWQSGKTASVPSISGFRISYGKLNGENLLWNSGENLKIHSKDTYWPMPKQQWTFDYNEFYGEANVYYGLYFPMGPTNGRLYPTVKDAFDHEGVYPDLMVSGDDISDVDGHSDIPWKTETTLTAFDMCRNYQGEGYNDWRLPRLSELAWLYLNKASLEKTRGFTPFANTLYWSASEYLVSNSPQDQKHSERAWCIDFGKSNPGNASSDSKTIGHAIRCVRQMK